MEETLQGLQIGIDNMWLLIAGFMVMFMQPGFALVEAGFTRSKNTANILMKNLMDFSIGSLLYWIIGYGLMYGESLGGFVGMPDLFFMSLIQKITGSLISGLWRIQICQK